MGPTIFLQFLSLSFLRTERATTAPQLAPLASPTAAPEPQLAAAPAAAPHLPPSPVAAPSAARAAGPADRAVATSRDLVAARPAARAAAARHSIRTAAVPLELPPPGLVYKRACGEDHGAAGGYSTDWEDAWKGKEDGHRAPSSVSPSRYPRVGAAALLA
nr:uncharacterized protein LOC127315370 [Lolium perenne]